MPTLLFVDDEAGIRETLPRILDMRGFDTIAVGTVPEALAQIASRKFDVLVTDLNIGEPGDGFTVVSAMRRTHPECREIILTGYPALEIAMTAIRAQVDDYILKPVSAESLIEVIEENLDKPSREAPEEGKRVSAILRENKQEITARTLAKMKEHPTMATVSLSDAERTDDLPQMLTLIADILDSEQPDQSNVTLLHAAMKHGDERFRQGYTVDMLVTGARLFFDALTDVIHENLLSINLSFLIMDMKWMTLGLALELEESIRAFVDAQQRAAA